MKRIVRIMKFLRAQSGIVIFDLWQLSLMTHVMIADHIDGSYKFVIACGWGTCLVLANMYYGFHRYWINSAHRWADSTDEWQKIAERWRTEAERMHSIRELNDKFYNLPPREGE